MGIHHFQTQPDSCVAAVMCMIQCWRGEAPTEARFHERSCYEPHYITTLPRVEARSIDPDMEHEVRLCLQLGKIVVVKVVVRNYENWRSTAYPDLRSPHGMMNSGHHMVVLSSDERNGYQLLDPFYPGDTQPLTVSDDDFVQWFTGHAFIASP